MKNPPHPPWFEASTDINIFMFIFQRFYQVVSLKPPNHSNQKPRTFLVCKNVKLFFFENTTSYHVSFFMLFTHRWKNTGETKILNLILPLQIFSSSIQIRGSSFLRNELLPYLFLEETGWVGSFHLMTCNLKCVST